jgi:hypothetical protein
MKVMSSFVKHKSPLNTVMNITNNCTSVTPETDKKKTMPRNITSMLPSPSQVTWHFQVPHKFHGASKSLTSFTMLPKSLTSFMMLPKSLTRFMMLPNPSQVSQ